MLGSSHTLEKSHDLLHHDPTRLRRAPPSARVRAAVDLARSARRVDLLRLLALSSFLALLGTWSAQPGLRTRVRSGGPGLLYKGADAPGARLYIVCSLLCGMGATGEPGGARATQTFCCSNASPRHGDDSNQHLLPFPPLFAGEPVSMTKHNRHKLSLAKPRARAAGAQGATTT